MFWLASVQSCLAHMQDVCPLQVASVLSALKMMDKEIVHLAEPVQSLCALRK